MLTSLLHFNVVRHVRREINQVKIRISSSYQKYT